MDIWIARQPIFDQEQVAYAYEIDYRGGKNLFQNQEENDTASASVIVDGLITIGTKQISEGKPIFVRMTDRIMQYEAPSLFDPNQVVVSLMQQQFSQKDVLKKCKALKKSGYRICFDDYYIYQERLQEEMLECLDYIKVDFTKNSVLEREDLATMFKKRKVKLIAGRVETQEEFTEAVDMGYDCFQGYFFRKPEIIKHRDIPMFKLNALHIIAELNREEPSYDHLEHIIKTDPSLTYKILRLVNSAANIREGSIRSIKHALVMLGMDTIRKLVYLVLLYEISENQPNEIIRNAMVRAWFGEKIKVHPNFEIIPGEVFMMEILSVMDVLMNRPMEELLEEIPISKRVKDGLLGIDNNYYRVHKMIEAYENGDWKSYLKFEEMLGIKNQKIGKCYLKALQQTREIFTTWDHYKM